MPRRTPAADALTELILEVFRVNGDLLVAGNRITNPLGQTSGRWQVLGTLRNGPLTVAAAAREMGLARQSIQRTADLLASEGLVEFVDNPAHKRAKLVSLTVRGQELLAQISARQVAWTHRLAGAMGFDERRVRSALEVLRALRVELEREEKLEPGGQSGKDSRSKPHLKE